MTESAILDLMRLRLGEPANADDARWTPDQLRLAYKEGRRWFCEESRSLQVKESQATVAGTKFYTVPSDVIDFWAVEYDGVEMDPVVPSEWRELVGTNEDIRGWSVVYKYFARQIQVFPVPDQAKTLRYHGWVYPADIVAGQPDTEFTERQADGAIFRAVWQLKEADERNFDSAKAEALAIAAKFKEQYEPRGTRYSRTRQSINPVWAAIRGGA